MQLPKYLPRQLSSRIIALGAVLTVAVAGSAVILATHAATAVFSFEGESVSLSGTASKVADANASGGSYLHFGATTTVTPPPPSGSLPAVRGFIENSDGAHNALLHSLGYTASYASPSTSALTTAASNGMKAIVWMGDYNNTSCTFNVSDATITSEVNAIKSHSALLGYMLTDEPEQADTACPNVASQIKARSDMIHQLDSSHFTYQIVSNQGTNLKCYDYAKFMGTTDIMGLDIYPLRQNASYIPCVSDPTKPWNDVSQAISAFKTQGAAYQATHAGFTPRFYAVLQDFQDSFWRRPTVPELQAQWAAWQGSGMEGIWYFSWDWQGNSLDGNTTHQCQFKIENQVVPSC